MQMEATVAAAGPTAELASLLAVDVGVVPFTHQLRETLAAARTLLDLDASAALTALASARDTLQPVLAKAPAALVALNVVATVGTPSSPCPSIRAGLSASSAALDAAATLATPSLNITTAVDSVVTSVTLAPGEVLCAPCALAALDALSDAVVEGRAFVGAALAVVQGVPALLPPVSAAVAAVGKVVELAPALATAASAVKGVQSAVASSPIPLLSAVIPTTAVVRGLLLASVSASDTAGRRDLVATRVDRVRNVTASQAAFLGRFANVTASGPGRLRGLLQGFVTFGDSLEALLDSPTMLTVSRLAQASYGSAFDKAFVIVQALSRGLHRVQTALNDVSRGILGIKSKVDMVRDKLLAAVRIVEGDPGPLLPLPTCKNTTSTAPPCLHPVHRTRDSIREILFPLNFPILVRASRCHRQGEFELSPSTGASSSRGPQWHTVSLCTPYSLRWCVQVAVQRSKCVPLCGLVTWTLACQ